MALLSEQSVAFSMSDAPLEIEMTDCSYSLIENPQNQEALDLASPMRKDRPATLCLEVFRKDRRQY
jgi:hypothetical protein